MRRKTYHNFLLVMDILQDVKHYSASDAEKLTRRVFENAEADPLKRPVEYWLDKVIPWEEYVEQ